MVKAYKDKDWIISRIVEGDADLPVVAITKLTLSGSKGCFAFALVNGIVKLLDAETGKMLAEIGAHTR